MTNPPPWLLLLLIIPLAISEELVLDKKTSLSDSGDSNNKTLVRANRGTKERERRLIQQYPTYYLAHSYTDASGERRNVLIPVHAGQPGATSNTLQPTTTPSYGQFSPSPTPHTMLLSSHNVGLPKSQPLLASQNGPTELTYTEKAGKSQVQQPFLQLQPVTGHKFHYKPPPTKLYSLDVGHRFRPRLRPDKNKYTATKLQFALNTTPSPYINKVKFELADAMIPSDYSIGLQPIRTPHSMPTQILAPQPASPQQGLSQYLEQETPKTFYYQPQKFSHNIQLIQVSQPDMNQEIQRPSGKPQIEPQQIQYIQSNELGPSPQPPTESPEIHYTPSSRPATLHQHYTQAQRPHTQQQIEYVPVTDIEPSSQPAQQHIPGVSHLTQLMLESEGTRPSQQPNIQHVFESEEVRSSPQPQPQVHYASQSGAISATSPSVQYNPEGTTASENSDESSKPSPQPEVYYPSDSHILRLSPQYAQDTNEVTPTAQPDIPIAPESPSERPLPQQQVQYVEDTSTAQPAYQYETDPNAITHATQELSYTQGKYPPTVQEAFNILKQTNQLPQRITPDNIDGSIKTLALILQRLQQHNPHQGSTHHEKPKVQDSYQKVKHPNHEQTYPQVSGGSTPGQPGVDYPIYSTIPKTSFDCSTQRYKGFFGDPETQCQVWHYCDLNGGQASFLCPNGTIFNQVALTCDWWFNVKCASTSQLYVLNERLYKYILPFAPSFPEDYSGPVVDKYLAAKFKEQEAKNKIKALKALITTPAPEPPSATPEVTTASTVLKRHVPKAELTD